MTIDLEEIPARIHHVVRFELWKHPAPICPALKWREAGIFFVKHWKLFPICYKAWRRQAGQHRHPDGRAFKRTCFLPFSFFDFASQSVSVSFISRNQFTAFCYPRRTLITSFCLLPSTCHHSVKRLCFSCDCGDTKQGSAWHCRYGL